MTSTRASRGAKSQPPASSRAVEDIALRLPIEELARRTGMTVRNLRELQTRGLLEPPILQGRKGFYGDAHLARVALIRRLQDRGYSLASIGDLLLRWTTSGGVLSNLENAVMAPAAGLREPLARDELLRILPELAGDARLMARAREVGLVDGEGTRLQAPIGELAHIARAFIDGGVPLSALLDELAVLRVDVARIGGRFRAMFQRHVVDELQRQSLPSEKMGELAATIAHLRPLGVRATSILLGEAVEGEAPAAGTEGKRRAGPRKGRKATGR